MKRSLILGSLLLAGVAFYFGTQTSDPFYQNIISEIFGTFVSLALGLIIVNVYLESAAKRQAVRSLFQLCNESIARFHNQWLNLCWAKFGRDGFTELGLEYIKSSGKPQALKKDVRDAIYNLVKGNTSLLLLIDRLEETMTELSRMAGWSLDPNLLSACLEARLAIARLKASTWDDTDATIDHVTEHIIDVDLMSQHARHILITLSGTKTE